MWRGLISSLRWCSSAQLRLKANHRHCSRPSCFLQQYWCYTLLCTQAHRERERDRKERQKTRRVNTEKKRSRSLRKRRERREERTISLSIITKTKMQRIHGMPPERVRCDTPPASSREQSVKKKQG